LSGKNSCQFRNLKRIRGYGESPVLLVSLAQGRFGQDTRIDRRDAYPTRKSAETDDDPKRKSGRGIGILPMILMNSAGFAAQRGTEPEANQPDATFLKSR